MASSNTRRPSFIELFTPKLVTVLREGYGAADLRADLVAGLTVAVVALPLSMAIAIASGVTPERGLYSAIIGGLIISALGGSRYQIGGPAAAFIVLVASTVQAFGPQGLFTAVFLSGLLIALVGLLRLGTFIRYIPYPVTVGFTAGIALIIGIGQLKDALGLKLAAPEPGAILPKLTAFAAARDTISPAAAAITLLSLATIAAVRRWRPHWPGYLLAIALAAVCVSLLHLDVETVGSRFGGIPGRLPTPSLPDLAPARVLEVLPRAIAFALLGSIESLLSAVVADGMSGRRHRSNCELVAQGLANIAAACFGGICVTGTIARTATNVRAGARGPVSGIAQAIFLLLFMLVGAALARFIPLAALAAVLLAVAWNMAEKHEIMVLLRSSRGDAFVLLVTLTLVVFRDLTEGIVVGFGLGALLFLHRMAEAVDVEYGSSLTQTDIADGTEAGARNLDLETLVHRPGIVVYRISGAFFFGAANAIGAALDDIGEHPTRYILDLSNVHVLDSTGANLIEGLVRRAERNGAAVGIVTSDPAIARMLRAHRVAPPRVSAYADLAAAARATAAEPPPLPTRVTAEA